MPKQIKKIEKTLYQVSLLETEFVCGQELYHEVIKRIVYVNNDKVDKLYIGKGVTLSSNNILSAHEYGYLDAIEIGGTEIRYNKLILLEMEKFEN